MKTVLSAAGAKRGIRSVKSVPTIHLGLAGRRPAWTQFVQIAKYIHLSLVQMTKCICTSFFTVLLCSATACLHVFQKLITSFIRLFKISHPVYSFAMNLLYTDPLVRTKLFLCHQKQYIFKTYIFIFKLTNEECNAQKGETTHFSVFHICKYRSNCSQY